MRTIEYLSPTSIDLFETNPEEFYLKHLADERPPKIPQTRPMSVGSAFDAYVKSYLHETLFGKGNDPRFEFDTLFETQVEPVNRTWAKEAGAYAFGCYIQSGALADLMLTLGSATSCTFEFTVQGTVGGVLEGNVGDVVFLGKPDAYFTTADGMRVILDWKVNGFCSRSAVSPCSGYVMIRDGWDALTAPPSRGANMPHKNCWPVEHGGMKINSSLGLEQVSQTWARQTAIYSWLCGEPVGGDFIVAIDQLVCKPNSSKPLIRVAQHRCFIGAEYQQAVYRRACEIWDVVHSDWIFRNVSREASAARCKVLDQQAAALAIHDDKDQWFLEVTRG